MKKILKKIYIVFSKFVLNIFYDKKYLKGKYFENGNIKGYKWGWSCLWQQKILKRRNARFPWPVSPYIIVARPENIIFDLDDMNNFHNIGCYFQNGEGKIYIGKGSYIGPNVGIITSNHDINDLTKHEPAKDVVIGKYCWVGMNSVILPGVVLGDKTIVGAGSIVTKSFPGKCIIAGNPAKIIKENL